MKKVHPKKVHQNKYPKQNSNFYSKKIFLRKLPNLEKFGEMKKKKNNGQHICNFVSILKCIVLFSIL